MSTIQAANTSTTAVTTTAKETSNNASSASITCMNWLLSAQDVFKEQTQTEYQLQNTSLNEMDYQNQVIETANQKYGSIADKMGKGKKVKGLSSSLIIGLSVGLFFVGGIGGAIIPAIGIGALLGEEHCKASWDNLTSLNSGDGFTATTRVSRDAKDLQKLSAKGQYWVSRMQAVQTEQNKSSSIMQNHSQSATASQNNFLSLINFQQKLTAKF
jgi:hypothetical protein